MHKRQREAWCNLVPLFLRIKSEQEALNSGTICCICKAESADMRCLDCGYWICYCSNCCYQQHYNKNIYHTPERWDGYRFIMAPCSDIVLKLDHTCFTSFIEKMAIIDLNRMFNLLLCFHPNTIAFRSTPCNGRVLCLSY